MNVVVTFAEAVAMKCVVNHRSSYNFIRRDVLKGLEEKLGQKFSKHGEVRGLSNGKSVLCKGIALDIELQGNIKISQASFLVIEELNGIDAILGTNLLDDLLKEVSIHPDVAY